MGKEINKTNLIILISITLILAGGFYIYTFSFYLGNKHPSDSFKSISLSPPSCLGEEISNDRLCPYKSDSLCRLIWRDVCK